MRLLTMISQKNRDTARTESYIARANNELRKHDLDSLMWIQRTVQYGTVELVGNERYIGTLWDSDRTERALEELRSTGYVLIDYETDDEDVAHAVQRLLLRTLMASEGVR